MSIGLVVGSQYRITYLFDCHRKMIFSDIIGVAWDAQASPEFPPGLKRSLLMPWRPVQNFVAARGQEASG